MSGTVTGNVFKSSGVIEATSASLNWSSAVITASTLTASAGNGYFINTTSNACTVTLPASPAIGDQIVFADYARTWATNNLIIDSNGNNFQGENDTYIVDYDTAGQSLNIVYSDATKGWLPVSDDAVASAGIAPVTQKAIFAFGDNGSPSGISNIVSSSGVVASDVSAVGTARSGLMAVSYNYDKVVMMYGENGSGYASISNLISNSGVVAADTTSIAGTARSYGAGVSYGSSGLGLIAFGYGGSNTNVKNLINSSGTVSADVTGVGTARRGLGATKYGTGLALFAFGQVSGTVNTRNLVSTSGVIASDVSGVGTARAGVEAAGYDGDKGLFCYGGQTSTRNKVSNTGVVNSDQSGAGTARTDTAASEYGGDKAIFGFGYSNQYLGVTNLVNTGGVIGSDVSAVGTARKNPGAAGFSFSA